MSNTSTNRLLSYWRCLICHMKALPSVPLFGVKKQLRTISELEGVLVPSSVLVGEPWFGQDVGIRRHYKSAPLQERKMIDRRRVHVKGGDGGDGCTSFRRSRHNRYGEADGGRGGRGGDVIFHCTDEFWDFSHLQHHCNGKQGGNGSSKKRIGSRGQDKIVPVPMGTVLHLVSGQIPSIADCSIDDVDDKWELGHSVHNAHHYDEEDESEELSDSSLQEVDEDAETDDGSGMDMDCGNFDDNAGMDMGDDSDDDDFEQSNAARNDTIRRSSVAELVKPGEKLTVACGGEGGRGNAAMARGRGVNKQLPSREHETGHPGTEAFLVLELKTIADVGFVGAPNAGKSTLLGAISRAKPKVGHYAFTTLRPNLGKLEFEDFLSITVADIPGLLKGAHKNVGLGHDFLRHIERTQVLVYVVDLAAGGAGNKGVLPWVQYEDLKYELEMYQPGLSEKPSLIVATKLDEKGAVEGLEELKKRVPLQILPVCALLEQGIDELRVALRETVTGERY